MLFFFYSGKVKCCNINISFLDKFLNLVWICLSKMVNFDLVLRIFNVIWDKIIVVLKG